jgi:UDP:flavonoid glycosyltransferase YjiC (YdhE family)
VQPYLALGVGLQARGHPVRLATHADFADLVRQHGLDFHPIERCGQELQASPAGQRMLQAGDNPVVFLREFARLRLPLVREMMEACRQACADADEILLSPTALFISLSVAEKLQRPTCWTALQPAALTRHLPNFLFPPAPRWLPIPGLYNLATHVLAAETFWQLMRSALNDARREVLGLEALPLLGPARELLRKRLRLFGYSPLVVPPPPDWGDENQVTGYWFLREPEYQPAEELVRFLEAGPPPVYIGFGSNHDADPHAVTRLVLEALERVGMRGLLHTGWGGLEQVKASDRVLSIGAVPHEWLLPRMAAVVHHGGAGTTGAALRSGVPSLVVPFFSDQPFWARRTFELGVGPAPIPRRQLTAQRLADALRQAQTDSRMREAAAQLGIRLRGEDGVGRAVEVFEQHVAEGEFAPVHPESRRQVMASGAA